MDIGIKTPQKRLKATYSTTGFLLGHTLFPGPKWEVQSLATSSLPCHGECNRKPNPNIGASTSRIGLPGVMVCCHCTTTKLLYYDDIGLKIL